jgi:hypothetical protein
VYPEDRVLIAYLPEPADFARVREEGWYRVPQKYAPKGLYAEYYAFYFGRKFGDQKYAIHYYARQTGFELARRVDLLPDQPDHPRAEALYYKVALGPLQTLAQPIVSLRWRRVSFMHTTWDRFVDAREINDLLLNGGEYVDRLYATLKERGITAKRNYQVKDARGAYKVPLAVLSGNDLLEFYEGDAPASDAGRERLADKIARGLARAS